MQEVRKIAFIANAVNCLAGGIGFVFGILPLTFITMNLIVGGIVLTLMVSLIFFFARYPVTQIRNQEADVVLYSK